MHLLMYKSKGMDPRGTRHRQNHSIPRSPGLMQGLFNRRTLEDRQDECYHVIGILSFGVKLEDMWSGLLDPARQNERR